jgi:hypothetical protein
MAFSLIPVPLANLITFKAYPLPKLNAFFNGPLDRIPFERCAKHLNLPRLLPLPAVHHGRGNAEISHFLLLA